jgi:hypothetical protein
MKTNRVTLDDSESTNYTSTLLNKIREKYKANKALQMSERTQNSGRSQASGQEGTLPIQVPINNPILSENVLTLERRNLIDGNQNQDLFYGNLQTPVNKTINVDFSFLHSAKETKDETDLKNRESSGNPFFPLRTSSAKILSNTVREKSIDKSERAQRQKSNFLNLLNLKIEKDNYKTEYFAEEKSEKCETNLSHYKNENFDQNNFHSLVKKCDKSENIKTSQKIKNDNSSHHPQPKPRNPISKIFFPRPGEFPSQISFEEIDEVFSKNLTENLNLDSCTYSSMGKSFYSDSESNYPSLLSCSQCDCEECNDNCSCHESHFYEGLEKEINRREKDRIRQQELENTHLLSKKMLKLKLELNNPKDFTEYRLTRSQVPLSPSNVTHDLLPLRYKDDEKYKKRLFDYLRKPEFGGLKTDTLKLSTNQRKFSQAFDGNLTKYYETTGMKRRKVTSEKKLFEAEHAFTDNRAVPSESGQLPPQYFKIYNDKDIGFPTRWQKQLRQSEMDDDVETDEDQLRAADRHIIRELGDGIRYYVKNKKNVRNLALLSASN